MQGDGGRPADVLRHRLTSPSIAFHRLTVPLVVFVIGSVGVADRQVSDSLSPYQRAKAEWLLTERLACLGCHQLDGAGGRIGPDLSNVGSRRSTEFIRAVLVDPQARNPNSVMPRIPLTRATRELLVTYLAERGGSASGSASPEPVGDRSAAPVTVAAPRETYQRFCAACHGAEGRGDGPNARYLPVRPTAHADSGYMSSRPDDVLYDAIAAGGYVMNRSNRMPAFGHTLSSETIRGLVRYLRELCRCEGPAWSRDGLQ